MEKRKGNCIFAQSGGPTAVINAGIAGGVLTALSREEIGKVYCAEHGVRGVLDERFFDMGEEDEAELLALRNTPASAIRITGESLRFSANTTCVISSITAETTAWTPA